MIIETGYQNWLKVNVQLENDFINKSAVSINIDKCLKKMNFSEASDYTANLISEKYDNIHLLLSGGLDSEYVAKVFLRNKLAFTPVLLINQTNISEIWYALKFCQENNLNPKILDYSQNYQEHTKLLKLIFDLSLKLKISPNLSIFPNLISSLIKDASILTGCGDAPGNMPSNSSEIFNRTIEDTLYIDGAFYYIHLSVNRPHPGAFFSYTPEIFKSYIEELDYNDNIQLSKSKLYGILPRSKIIFDLHSISDSVVLKNMIINRLSSLSHIDNVIPINKFDVLKKLEFD